MTQRDIEILKNLSYEQACQICPGMLEEDFWQLKSIIDESILDESDNYENIYESLADALELLVEQNQKVRRSMKIMLRDMKIDGILGESDDESIDEIDEDDFFKDL